MDCALVEHGRAISGLVLQCITEPDPWWRITLAIATPILVLISAGIAWQSLQTARATAKQNLDNTRALARQKATLDLIEKAESSKHYQDLLAAFTDVRMREAFAELNDPDTDAKIEQRRKVLTYLNHYELVAIGIESGILDDIFYRNWMQSTAVMEWNAAAPLVQAERWRLNKEKTDFEYRGQLFVNLQRAVCRWSKDAIFLDKNWSPKPPLPENRDALGDTPLPATEPVTPPE